MRKRILFIAVIILSLLLGVGGIKKVEAQTNKILCDKDGMLVINNKRTFIIGSYYLPKEANPYKELAINGYNYIKVKGSGYELDSAWHYHLRTWVSTGSIKNNSQKDKNRIAELVNRIKGHPSLMCFEMEDEPAFTWNSAELRIPPEQMQTTYRLIKQNDPQHFVITNHGPVNLISTLQKYNSSTDIVSCDIYPVIPHGIKVGYALYPDGFQGDLLNTYISQVGEYVDKMKKVVNNLKPVFMVLQGFAWEMLKPEDKRDNQMILYPTFDESRFMAWDAIVHGATGIIYWGTDFTPQPSEFMDNLNRVTKELASLKNVLASKNESLSIKKEYHELRYSVDRGVEFIAKRVKDKTYLITVNSDKNPVKITFHNLNKFKIVRVLNENRTISLEEGKLTDSYKPFDVHIYELSKQ
ncbi:MAG: hypothetical protein Q8891_12135 [Bacteroidota bacterium]|nr:hypothetical protein [Bacteroidota bacterium]